MKVALVFQSLGIGGIERVGLEYSRLFLDLGYEVDIYNLTPEANQMEVRFPKECGIYHKYLPEFMLPDRYLNGVKRWWWGKYVYPIIYLGTSALLYLFRLTMGARKTYDITIAFSGHFRDLTFVSRSFIKGRKKIAWLHGSLMDYMISSSAYGDIYRKLGNICTLSSQNQQVVLHRNIFLRNLNIHRIYNPISLSTDDLEPSFVKELNETYGDFLLMVGRFDTDKDQKTVIEAYRQLYRQGHISNKLLFVGDGPTISDCKKLVHKYHLQEQIFFLGTRQDVGNFYAAAKLFVHSSPTEGLPTVLLEAMKYGVPIVATNSPPGVNEILENDTYGLTCPVGDSKGLADKINLILRDPDLYEHYKKQGQTRIQDFSYDRIRDQLNMILQHLK